MKKFCCSLFAASFLILTGCGGATTGVTEIPLSDKTGYTPEQEKSMSASGIMEDPKQDAIDAAYRAQNPFDQ